jgi:hypothetical protein
LHFAVAPVGSLLVGVAVGADFEADDLEAAGAVPVAGVPVAGAAEEALASEASLLFDAFWTPPWPLHAPRPVAVEVVPSLQVVGVPEAGGAAGAAGEAAAGAGAAGAADWAAAVFWTPPWPLHAPRPVAVEVVPSLQTVGALDSAARADRPIANTNIIKDPARSPVSLVFFMIHSPGVASPLDCKPIGVKANFEP